MTTTGRIMGAIILFAALTGCSHTAPSQPMPLSDGTNGWRITCGGIFLGITDCYDQATNMCMDHSYKVLRKTDIVSPSSTYFWNTIEMHEIVVKCDSGNHV